MKLSAKTYRGIEYVVERDMPEDQRKRLSETSSNVEFIKILLADGTIVDRCLTYKDYCAWYDAFFVTSAQPANDGTKAAPNVSVRIAFNT